MIGWWTTDTTTKPVSSRRMKRKQRLRGKREKLWRKLTQPDGPWCGDLSSDQVSGVLCTRIVSIYVSPRHYFRSSVMMLNWWTGSLDLENFKLLLGDVPFQNAVQESFFAGEMSQFLRAQEIPTKRTRSGKALQRRFDMEKIINLVGESITSKSPELWPTCKLLVLKYVQYWETMRIVSTTNMLITSLISEYITYDEITGVYK